MNIVLKTIFFSFSFSLLGLVAGSLSREIWPFPLLFSLGIPLANWKALGHGKGWKLLVIAALTMLILGIGLMLEFVVAGSGIRWLFLLMSGVTGAILLSVYAKFISNIHAGLMTYVITFILCVIAGPFGDWILLSTIHESNSGTLFLIWTICFTLGVAFGIARKSWLFANGPINDRAKG